MSEPNPIDHGLITALQNLLGGAATAMVAAIVGRAMWHAQEVRAKRRPIMSTDLLWEVPLAIGMALIGDALASYLGLSREVGVGLIAVLSYLGPRGAGAIFEKWMSRK